MNRRIFLQAFASLMAVFGIKNVVAAPVQRENPDNLPVVEFQNQKISNGLEILEGMPFRPGTKFLVNEYYGKSDRCWKRERRVWIKKSSMLPCSGIRYGEMLLKGETFPKSHLNSHNYIHFSIHTTVNTIFVPMAQSHFTLYDEDIVRNLNERARIENQEK